MTTAFTAKTQVHLIRSWPVKMMIHFNRFRFRNPARLLTLRSCKTTNASQIRYNSWFYCPFCSRFQGFGRWFCAFSWLDGCATLDGQTELGGSSTRREIRSGFASVLFPTFRTHSRPSLLSNAQRGLLGNYTLPLISNGTNRLQVVTKRTRRYWLQKWNRC